MLACPLLSDIMTVVGAPVVRRCTPTDGCVLTDSIRVIPAFLALRLLTSAGSYSRVSIRTLFEYPVRMQLEMKSSITQYWYLRASLHRT